MSKKPTTADYILQTLTQHKKPMTVSQIAEQTGLTNSKIRHAAANLAKPNTQRKALIQRLKTGVYQIINQEQPTTQTQLPLNITEQVEAAFKNINRPANYSEIVKETGLTRKQVKNAIQRLKKNTKIRPPVIQQVEKGIYELIPTDTAEEQPEQQSDPTAQAEEQSEPTPQGLQHPPPVPVYLPPDTATIKDFETAQHNAHRLWLLHKSIKQSLRVLETFGETIPLPDLLTDTEEAKQYAEAIKTYLISSILYQQAIVAFEKNPLQPLSTQQQLEQQLDETEEEAEEITIETVEEKLNEPTDFTFAGENFENIQDLQNTVQAIKTESELNKPIQGADQTILFQLLRYAPNYKEITRTGIHQFQVQLADRYNPESRIFTLIKQDGNKIKINTDQYIKRFKDGEQPAEIQK